MCTTIQDAFGKAHYNEAGLMSVIDSFSSMDNYIL